MFKRSSGAAPNTKIVVKGARQKVISFAEECKLQGNAFFVSLDYAKAIECYSKCISEIEQENELDLISDP